MADSVTIVDDASPELISSDQQTNQTVHSKELGAGSTVESARSTSPAPSYSSMKSNESMDRIVKFEQGPDLISSDQTSSHHKPQQTDQTVKSKDLGADAGSTVELARSTSPAPSYSSMKSNESMDRIVKFEQGPDLISSDQTSSHHKPQQTDQTVKSKDLGADAGGCIKGIPLKIPRIFVNESVDCVDSTQSQSNNIGNDPGLLTSTTGSHIERADSADTSYSSVHFASMESEETHHNADIESTDVKHDLDPPEIQGGHGKAIKEAQQSLKQRYKEHFEYALEIVENCGTRSRFNNIYTELYITAVGSDKCNREHEVLQLERVSKLKTADIAIKCNDIFRPSLTQQMSLKTVLTKGIAGIGKTFTVRKFIIDWAEGNANQDIDFILLLPFRDLNLKKGKEYSLVNLMYNYFPEMENIAFDELKVVIIFDGLDECRLKLDFSKHPRLADINEPASVDILLTNIIRGSLLSRSSLWITSRPAATNQLPAECVQRVTEIRGFHDVQKEDYFRRRIQDPAQAERVIKHIKSSRSLHIMCYMPVFCCVSASVLQTMPCQSGGDGVAPKTLTQMFTHFLVIELQLKHEKDQAKNLAQTDSDQEILVKLGKLALQNLEKGQMVFYEEELTECGISVEEHNELFAQMFRQESGIFKEKVYCFVHLSIQEYLAALYAVIMCRKDEVNVLTTEESCHCTSPECMSPIEKRLNVSFDEQVWFSLCKTAVDKALQKENGEFDLFLRFLLGLSLESTQKILGGHFPWTAISPDAVTNIITFLRKKIRESPSPERTINLFHCLHEMNDNSFVEEVQRVMSSEKMLSDSMILEPDQCSALAYMLLMSEKVQDVFDMKIYNTTDMGMQRLIPVVKSCKSAILNACYLSEPSCEIIVSALQTVDSHLVELDLSHNNLQDLIESFSSGFKNENCKLEKLILRACNLTKVSCSDISSVILCPHSHLREMDLSGNALQDEGVQHLCKSLLSQHCNIEKLRLGDCSLTGSSCTFLSSVLESPQSRLRQLVLDNNDLHTSGVQILSTILGKSHCKLEKLGLSGCRVIEEGCRLLAKALKTNTALQHLDLSYNYPREPGKQLLSDLQKDSSNKLQTLHLEYDGQNRDRPGLRKYAVNLSFDPETTDGNISLNDGNTKVIQRPVDHRPLGSQKKHGEAVCKEGLTGRCYWETELGGKGQSEISVGLMTKDVGKCWSLQSTAFGPSFFAQYFNIVDPCKRKPIEIESPPFKRLGVFLDWSAGTMSFYSADPVNGPQSLLYAFHTTFTEPVYPFIRIQGPHSSVSLCYE